MTGASSRKQKENLNLFGHVYYSLCARLGVTGTQLALRTGVDPGTISRATRGEPARGTTKRIERRTLDKLYATMLLVAAEQGIKWKNDRVYPHLLRVAGFSTKEDQEESFAVLVDYLSD